MQIKDNHEIEAYFEFMGKYFITEKVGNMTVEQHQIPQTQLNFLFSLSMTSKGKTAKTELLEQLQRYEKNPQGNYLDSSLCQKQLLQHFLG